ncbi:MAG: riboflavin biosynthesis protein RibF [Clostridia bacterium]|nr:riboflavin biosynthesis protein RibF [Clostridia bacterium]
MAIRRVPGGQKLKNTCLCLGNFDGIHRGHQAILDACLSEAARNELTDVAWTFARHPEKFFPGHAGDSILSPEDKAELLEERGVSTLVEEDFTRVRDLSPAAFCRDVLLGELDAKEVICGFNFRFGKNGAGTPEDLRREMEAAGAQVLIVPPVLWKNEPISSTRVRAALKDGRPEDAEAMLGRPYFIRFPVAGGNRLGRKMGFPTINQIYPADYVIPRRGVYAVQAVIEGKCYDGVCNVGRRPTVEENGVDTAETHLFDFSGNLYGLVATVRFCAFLRPETRFENMDALRDQIGRDTRRAKEILTARRNRI